MKNLYKYSFWKGGLVFIERKLRNALFASMLIMLPCLLFAQDKTIDKANLAYQYKQYAQAASLYEIAIAEKEEKHPNSNLTLNLKTKLAFCYRMNNRMNEAEKLYAEIVQDERARSDTYFYYGETLMCNGKYEEAKKWFKDYQVLEPGDKQAALMAANCDKIQFIKPYFQNVETDTFMYNTDADDNAPVPWQNGIVFSSDRKQGIKFMKEKSGWTGRDYLDLYFSAIRDDNTYSEPRRFSAKLSEVNKNTGNASFSMDGKEVFFTRNDNVLNSKNTYNLQLFSSENNGNGKWKKAEKLSFCSPNYSFMHPAISPDGQELFFATNRNGEGGTDLWVSNRKNKGWGRPKNLGPTVNTSANEGFPFVDENGRLYFCSKGHPGYGGFDIFFTERDESGNWRTPQNIGVPFNGPLDDISIYINASGTSGMFTSSRGGGDDNIFFFNVPDAVPTTDPLVEIVPVGNESPEPFINKKPAARQAEAKGMEVPMEIPEATAEQPSPPITNVEKEVSDSLTIVEASVAEVPEVYQSVEETDGGMSGGELRATEPKEVYDPFSDVPLHPETSQEELKDKTVSSQSSNIFFEMPDESQTPDNGEEETTILDTPAANTLSTFRKFMDRAHSSNLKPGEIYRINGAIFDQNVWQLTPRISRKLNDLVAVMRRYPSLEIELSAHTEALGPATQNLEISRNRVNMAVTYIVKEGIDAKRIKGEGYGESQLLNNCLDGVTCSMEEHLYNQRLEVRVLKGID